MPDKLVITKSNAEVVMISDNLLRDDLDNGLTPKKYLDQNIDQTSFLSKNTLIEEKKIWSKFYWDTHTYTKMKQLTKKNMLDILCFF